MYANDHHDFGTIAGTGLRAVLAAPRRLLAGAARHRADQRAVETLLSLDDHLLRDIGVHRGDVERVVRGRRR